MPNQLGQLQDRGINKALQTRFSLSPDYNISLMPELAAVMNLPAEELLFMMGWRRWQAGKFVGNLAANFGRLRIANPVGSGILVMVESFVVGTATAQEFAATFNNTAVDEANLLTHDPREGRQLTGQANAQGIAHVSWGQTGAQVNATTADLFCPANDFRAIPGAPWELAPGQSMAASAVVANQSISFLVSWRERFLQEQENTP